MNQSNWEHVAYGAAITLTVGALVYPFVGAFTAIAFFYGRETRDAQMLKNLSDFAMLNPATWSPDGRRDFFPMAATSLALAAIIEWYPR